MLIHDIAALFSIFLTFPTLTTAFAVVARFWPAAKKTLFNDEETVDGKDWLIRGVFKGFVKDFFDNGYWLIPWSLVFLHSENAHIWIMSGVYVNCIVRQGIRISSARCHLRASEAELKNSKESFKYFWTFNRVFFVGCLLGLVFVYYLLKVYYGARSL